MAAQESEKKIEVAQEVAQREPDLFPKLDKQYGDEKNIKSADNKSS